MRICWKLKWNTQCTENPRLFWVPYFQTKRHKSFQDTENSGYTNWKSTLEIFDFAKFLAKKVTQKVLRWVAWKFFCICIKFTNAVTEIYEILFEVLWIFLEWPWFPRSLMDSFGTPSKITFHCPRIWRVFGRFDRCRLNWHTPMDFMGVKKVLLFLEKLRLKSRWFWLSDNCLIKSVFQKGLLVRFVL